ncbi:hypothetical protein ACWKWJ_14410 [Sphingopyxis terrae subsp. ummariensis]
MVNNVLEGLVEMGSVVGQDDKGERLLVNGEFSLSIVIARCTSTPTGLLRWKPRFDTALLPDITIVVRMDRMNQRPLDYYLFPRIDLAARRLRLAEDNGLGLDAYRFECLDYLYHIAAPVPLSEVA